jgi:hypothetical protein
MLIKTTFLFLLIYLFFIPIGPLPIEIIRGLNIDVLSGIVLLVLMLYYGKNINQYSVNFILLTAFFVFSTLVSVLLSGDIAHSLNNWLITMGYLYLTFTISIIHSRRIVFLQNFILLVAFLASVYILYDYFSAEQIQIARYSLTQSVELLEYQSRLDPNTTAIGLMFAVLLSMRNKLLYYRLPVFIVVISAVMILQSRTALLSFILAVILTQFYFSLKYKEYKKILPLLLSIFITILTIYFIFPDIVQIYLIRATSEANYYDRFELFNNSLAIFSSDIKSILFGAGYMMTNPHNEILRILSGSGLLGLLSYIFFLVYLLSLILKIRNKDMKFTSLFIFLYMFIAIQTYGHTKFMYVSYMFILLFYIQDKNNKII